MNVAQFFALARLKTKTVADQRRRELVCLYEMAILLRMIENRAAAGLLLADHCPICEGELSAGGGHHPNCALVARLDEYRNLF